MRHEAIEAMAPFLDNLYANPSGSHRFAREARKALDEARDVGGDARDGADIVAALALQITAFGAKVILHVHNKQRGMPRMQLPVHGAYNGRHFFFCLNSSGAGITVPQCLQVRKSSEVKKFS